MVPQFRVVLIEDDPDLRQLVQTTLEFLAGWRVTSAADGPTGIEAVRRARPDAVLVDVMMLGMDGYEVCRRLKGDPDTAAIPLVLLTARVQLDEQQVAEAGVAGVIAKPFDLEQLAPRVLALCGRA